MAGTKGETQVLSYEANQLGKVLKVLDSKTYAGEQRNHRLGSSFLGSEFAIFDAVDNRVLIWSVNDGKPVFRLQHPGGKFSLHSICRIRMFTYGTRRTITSSDCEYYLFNYSSVICRSPCGSHSVVKLKMGSLF